MSRPIKQEKNGRRMIGHATTRTASKLGRRDPGNDIAAACSGNSPASPPTATILARLVCRSLQVLPICGLIIVTEAPVSISALTFQSGKSSPTALPSSSSNGVALMRMSIRGPCCSNSAGLDEIYRFLRANLLHEKLAVNSERLQPGSKRRLLIRVEASD